MMEEFRKNRGKKLVLIGGGGHCKSVLDAALRMDAFCEVVITDNSMPAGTEIFGCKVMGNDEVLPQLYGDGYHNAFVAVGGIRDMELREQIYGNAKKLGFSFINIIDPSAAISERAKLGDGIFIGKNAAVNAGAVIGDMAIINTGAVIEHGCQIGRFSHVAVGAVICGDCQIGDAAFIGANATVIQGIKIGKDGIAGAGSVVLADVPENGKAIGISKGGWATDLVQYCVNNSVRALNQVLALLCPILVYHFKVKGKGSLVSFLEKGAA